MQISKKFTKKYYFKLIKILNNSREFVDISIILLNFKISKNAKQIKKIIKYLFFFKFSKNKDKAEQIEIKFKTLKYLNRWSDNLQSISTSKTVLVDCMWDNANYWLRYSFLRKAINLYEYREYALFNEFSIKSSKEILNSFNFTNLGSPISNTKVGLDYIWKAFLLVKDVNNNSDFLNIKLPYDFPISNLYDDILKIQLRATIDIKDKKIVYYLAQLLSFLDEIYNLFEKYKFDIVVLSHGMGFRYAVIAWLALERKIPVYVLYGDFSTKRFIFLESQRDLFSYPSRVTNSEISSLTKEYRELLTQRGYELINERFSGSAKDISTNYAYKKSFNNVDKNKICNLFKWDKNKPIIVIYSSVWFDYPHGCGLQNFNDFFDWISNTLKIASENKNVNWLVKPHPLEDYFPSMKGPKLVDLVESFNIDNLKIVKKGWDSTQLIKTVDGIITCHGTIGLEATILGVPILVPYLGYYGHLSFVNAPNNREEYFKTLSSDWYSNKPDQNSKDMAALFSAFYYGRPKWQKYLYSPDHYQDRIYKDIQEMFISESETVNNEIINLEKWVLSGHKYYQIFKILIDGQD